MMQNLAYHGDYKHHFILHEQKIVHLYRYSFIPVINCNTDKTGYYQLIVDEPIFENSCSYDAVEKVMYFYDTRTYTLHDACKTITLFNCKENRC